MIFFLNSASIARTALSEPNAYLFFSKHLARTVGQISVPDDFDRMGQEEIEQMFGGGT